LRKNKRKSIVTQKYILAKMCEDFNIPGRKMDYFYEFLVHRFNQLAENPEITVVKLSHSLGAMYSRSKLMKAFSEKNSDKTTPLTRKFVDIYKKRLETIGKAFDDPNLTHYSKTSTIGSYYLSEGMSKEEMELAQNEDFEKNNRVD
jgi:hypothetical protein